jgi:hypothetical protein
MMKKPEEMDRLLMVAAANQMLEQIGKLEVLAGTTHGDRLFVTLAVFDKIFQVWVKLEPEAEDEAKVEASQLLLAELKRIVEDEI